jgi:hypothetical protein
VHPDEVPGRCLVSYGVLIVFGSTSKLSGGCHWKIVCTRPAKLLTVSFRHSIFDQHPASRNTFEHQPFLERFSCAVSHLCVLFCRMNLLAPACLDIIKLLSSVNGRIPAGYFGPRTSASARTKRRIDHLRHTFLLAALTRMARGRVSFMMKETTRLFRQISSLLPYFRLPREQYPCFSYPKRLRSSLCCMRPLR